MAGPPKVLFPILIETTLTTVLHYRADCDCPSPDFSVPFQFYRLRVFLYDHEKQTYFATIFVFSSADFIHECGNICSVGCAAGRLEKVTCSFHLISA